MYLFCVVLCVVCMYMCTVLLPPSGYPIAVNKYINTAVVQRWIINTSFVIYILCIVNICIRWIVIQSADSHAQRRKGCATVVRFKLFGCELSEDGEQAKHVAARLTFWHRSFTFKFQHTLYVKCEYYSNQKRQHYEINGILKRKTESVQRV